MCDPSIPVITIDGPSASGKGTVARLVAQALGFHYLDSGALYRLVALRALRDNIDANDEMQLAEIARQINVSFENSLVWLDGQNVDDMIRAESCGEFASRIAHFPALRAALLQRQQDFRKLPGLVTDGRDMGSVVFPEATLKIYLTASVEERANRRYKQLKEKEINANISDLSRMLRERDQRDSSRALSPLRQHADAQLLDTSNLSIGQAVKRVLDRYAGIEAHARTRANPVE
ncbi:MAG: (d)CMP kinase [Nitrosomonas sp.]|nr:(d)CMP kinase [Nitrosomonas sp.]